jgi:DNA replication protein DnaC
MYQSKTYSNYFLNAEPSTVKRFKMVKDLSKNFTLENRLALSLDKMLMAFKALNDSENNVAAQTPPNLVSSNSNNNNSNPVTSPKKNLSSEFEQLFELLKDNIQTGQSSNARIQSIRYELPNRLLPDFEKPPILEFQQIIDDVMMGNNVFLVGGAGTGKSYTAENLISKNALGRNYITINCSQWTSPTEIIGGQTMDGYQEGKLIEAWKNGWVLILDELPKIDPNTAGLFNDALSKTKLSEAIIFNARKESFTKHADFACIATGNIYPNQESMLYGANNKQDLSLLDRFSGSVYFIEKNAIIEKQILQNDMLWSICDRVRTSIDELKYEGQLSLRFMQTARDAYNLEMLRLEAKRPGANRDNSNIQTISANEGKTFKSAMDSYLSTYTELQKKNIKTKLRYSDLFDNYEYRNNKTNQIIKF